MSDPRLYDVIEEHCKSTCPTCDAPCLLLSHPALFGMTPSFYVSMCGYIGQVGVGPVRECQKPSQYAAPYRTVEDCTREKPHDGPCNGWLMPACHRNQGRRP